MKNLKSEMFVYHKQNKRINGLVTIVSIIALVSIILYYYFYIRSSNNEYFKIINTFINYISNEINNGTKSGVLYSALFGGLFFVVIPTEIVFINFMIKNTLNPWILLGVYVAGIFVAYNVNYYIGYRLKEASKTIITPKKFYKIKGLLNKYGALSIYLLNAIPFLPAQPLSTILGVFNYNKSRFYFYSLIGLISKYATIVIIYNYLNIDLSNILK